MVKIKADSLEELFWQLWNETKVPRWALSEVFGDYVQVPAFVDDRYRPKLPAPDTSVAVYKALEEAAPVRQEDNIEVITVKDLSDEYGLAAREIRSILRAAGYSANKAEASSKPRYEWNLDSPDLVKVREIVQDYIKKI